MVDSELRAKNGIAMFTILYEEEGYSTNTVRLMGRHAAGESFPSRIYMLWLNERGRLFFYFLRQ